jgi:hypothetical protein
MRTMMLVLVVRVTPEGGVTYPPHLLTTDHCGRA